MVTFTLLSVCAHKFDMGLTGLKIKVSARLYFFSRKPRRLHFLASFSFLMPPTFFG